MTENPLFVPAPRMILVKNRQVMMDVLLDAVDLGCRDVVIGFAETEYVDSSGLKMLVALQQRLVRNLGGRLRLLDLNEELRCLFEATRLDRVFEIVDCVDGEPREWPVPEPTLAGLAA